MSADRNTETRKIDNTKKVMGSIIENRDPSLTIGCYTSDAAEVLGAIEEGALQKSPKRPAALDDAVETVTKLAEKGSIPPFSGVNLVNVLNRPEAVQLVEREKVEEIPVKIETVYFEVPTQRKYEPILESKQPAKNRFPKLNGSDIGYLMGLSLFPLSLIPEVVAISDNFILNSEMEKQAAEIVEKAYPNESLGIYLIDAAQKAELGKDVESAASTNAKEKQIAVERKALSEKLEISYKEKYRDRYNRNKLIMQIFAIPAGIFLLIGGIYMLGRIGDFFLGE